MKNWEKKIRNFINSNLDHSIYLDAGCSTCRKSIKKFVVVYDTQLYYATFCEDCIIDLNFKKDWKILKASNSKFWTKECLKYNFKNEINRLLEVYDDIEICLLENLFNEAVKEYCIESVIK